MAEQNVEGYPLARPTAPAALASLQRVLGSSKGRLAWEAACLKANVSPTGELTLEQLLKVAESLEGAGGLIRVLGVALRVRIETFVSLERLNQLDELATGRPQ